mgnify:CR=1 FL=1
MSLFRRVTVSLLVGLALVLAVYWLMPRYPFEAQGVVLPTAAHFPAYDGDVQLFSPGFAPPSAIKLGTISVQLHDQVATPESAQQLVTKAKQLARSAGGNGIVASMAHTIASTPKIESMSLLQGDVIHYTAETGL